MSEMVGLGLIDSVIFNPKKKALWLLNFGVFSVVKRIFDLVVALVLLILLSPLFLVVAILIKKEDGGKVFFRQVRTGQFGKEFKIFKFRSMVMNNDVHDKKCEDQYTKIGKVIRNLSIDELPQLLNVIKGEMSFIGPRPWITDYFENMIKTQKVRTLVKPGITGLAQANGRNGISIFDKIGYDVEYVKKFSILMDARVVFETIRSMVKKNESEVNAGKGGIHNELADLKADNKRYL
jgi:lipopolysaccharide/colanic/teichoic acid biosynthesis glycosyltransferase